ncbi:hypothetical protein GLAREA_08851 [Glarea lozoyensis ATCC 20868]|uniref:Uncharacterized protein n=1 Tax=Glarea lozoyensis (strain ATCC 20868 / MF5171) TaxID=1116229 RepID=S3EEM8_GLAL2|nr:uncharacterized protein GLAREA_08851 [Glarea lozoyensis ATCC 20868]EPE36688.1 hypothetical protein GLAREA_08851 [Glarea lozoyensis ATCC 20868]
MLRPTPTLASKLSKLGIHKPLPLSSRDAHKLLGLLKTSFRKHLDEEHGPSEASTAEDSLTNPSRPAPSILKPGSRQHPADRHFHAMLSNPLFTHAVVPGKFTGNRHEIFNQTVAAGGMNIELATRYLESVEAVKTSSSIECLKTDLKNSGAGLKVLQWLRSSGLSNGLEFLENDRFTRILMRFLVAEGLGDMAWAWVAKSLTISSSQPTPSIPENRLRIPLQFLIRAQVRLEMGITEACTLLRKASSLLRSLSFPRPLQDHIIYSARDSIIWNYLKYHSRMSPATEESYDILYSSLPNKPNDQKYFIFKAHLHLLHPTKPTAQPAMDILSTWQPSSEIRGNMTDEQLKKERFIIINLGLDLTNFLLTHDRIDEADWVMEYLSSNFPSALGVSKKLTQKRADATSEISSLDLLGALDMKIA